ncbi:MAG: aldehyde dehydrogenase family protein [Pirellulales bacterium]
MNARTAAAQRPWHLPAYLAGQPLMTERRREVRYPYDGTLTGSVSLVSLEDVGRAIEAMQAGRQELTRYQRYEILDRTRLLLQERRDEFADLIRWETGLCQRETRYEVGRAQDVLLFAAMEALRDDGQIFSCDISPQGKPRKIFTLREPLQMIFAITPFNHPLNQVVHKVAPAIAVGAPILLKPSEKTPLTATRFCELLFEAGLPGSMLSVFAGEVAGVVEPLLADPRIEMVTFTGGTNVGKRIASIAGYKKLCLELGGNSPLIVLPDADMDLAVELAAEGSYRNSGQRCTAIKRFLVHREIADEFTARFVARTREYVCGDPADEATRVGTVIDEAAAKVLERRVLLAVDQGAKVLVGGQRRGALMEPTVIADVPRHAEMVCEESFGPLSPILVVEDLEDAIKLANSSQYGLSCGVVTQRIDWALECVKKIRTGTVNVNQIPGFRIENSPFGGIKDSGLGIKEGVIEAMKYMTTVKTFSLPW